MNKNLTNFFVKWCYTDESKDYFTNNYDYICKTNLYILKNISKLFLCILTTFLLVAITVDRHLEKFYPYIFFIISNLITYIFTIKQKNKLYNSKYLNMIFILHLCSILIFSIYIGIFINPGMLASFTLISILGCQMVFILPPLYTSGTVLIGCICFSVLSLSIKTTSIGVIDTFNAFTTFLIGAFLGWYMLKIRIRDHLVKEELLRVNKQLEILSSTDELTGLTNRRVFNLSYETLFEQCKSEIKPLAVLMIDIDFFKLYNDNYGHLLGDECIRNISNAFKECSKESNISIYRLGGEEFISIISSSTFEEALEYAENLLTSIRNLKIPHEFSPVNNFVTISIGLHHSLVTNEFKSNDFIRFADTALYKAKNNGRNKVSI